jgi:hypothetical protein
VSLCRDAVHLEPTGRSKLLRRTRYLRVLTSCRQLPAGKCRHSANEPAKDKYSKRIELLLLPLTAQQSLLVVTGAADSWDGDDSRISRGRGW